jgi:hypothetical protein
MFINYNLNNKYIMSNRLTYKKIFIDSKYRTAQTRSSADFSIELNESFETPENTRMYITDVSIGAVWKTTEVGFYENLYVMVFDGDTLVKNFRVYVGNKVYFASQLCFDLNEGMNSNTSDFSAGGIFVYSYDEATRTVAFSIKEGLSYSIKIPTDEELETFVGGVWDTGSVSYNNKKPLSINYLLSNFVPSSPLRTWTSSYLNLIPFRYIFITSNSLSDYRYSAPNSYSSSIIRKILVTEQLGGVINDNQAGHTEVYIDIGGRNLKRLDFKITNAEGTVMNLYNIDVQFALLISTPNY